MIRKIKRVAKGQTPTLLEADKANELIDAINMLLNIQVYVKPDGAPEVIYGDNAVKIVVPTFDPTTIPKTPLTYCSNGVTKTKLFLNPIEESEQNNEAPPNNLGIESGEDLINYL
tara:strand:- start:2385 stop:2729 length:345 start_codon:yes stop_codon:yes gene_type:complete